MRCPICKREKVFEVLDIASAEADNLCLLCEAEAICLDCQKTKHPPQEVK